MEMWRLIRDIVGTAMWYCYSFRPGMIEGMCDTVQQALHERVRLETGCKKKAHGLKLRAHVSYACPYFAIKRLLGYSIRNAKPNPPLGRRFEPRP